MNLIKTLLVSLLLSANLITSVPAQTKVVVIPMGADQKPLQNVITVAKKNGDYTDPRAAINSISDSSAGNPYLVVIGPGVYTINSVISIPHYVDITGSGRDITVLKGDRSALYLGDPSAIITSGSYGTVSNLTIENSGSADGVRMGIYSGTMNLSQVNVRVSSSNPNSELYGVHLGGATSKRINDILIEVEGYSSNTGMTGNNNNFHMNNTIIQVRNGGNSNIGLDLWDQSSGPAYVNNLHAVAEDTNSYAVVVDSAALILRNSYLKGDSNALKESSNQASIINNILDGGVNDNVLTTSCRGNYSGTLTDVSC